MSKDRPVTIGPRTFQSQKTARAFFHGMLDRYRPGQVVSEADAAELLALVGGPSARFAVITNALGTRTFEMERDGTSTELSIADCVARRRPSVLAEVSRALREAVRDQLDEARTKFLARNLDPEGFVTCALTGDRILPADGHTDHRPPMTFDVIVSSFLQGSIPVLPLERHVLDAFRAHHQKVAKLVFVQRHLSLTKRG